MSHREALIARGLRLEYLTIGWNSVEALIALATGLMAGSIALVGFGLDSVIEVSSGAILLWRLHSDSDTEEREARERRAVRLVGVSFFALAGYLLFDATRILLARQAPARSLPGILLAIASLIMMPLLARAKRRVASNIGSGALHADSRQTDICAYLSAITLTGLVLNAARGWWWADAAAGLLMIPLISKEGLAAWRGKVCCAGCSTS